MPGYLGEYNKQGVGRCSPLQSSMITYIFRMSSSSSLGGVKRVKKSGSANISYRERQKQENEELSRSIQNYLMHQGNASNNGRQERIEIHNEEHRNTAVDEIFDREQMAPVAVEVDNQGRMAPVAVEVDNQEEMAPVIVELEEESIAITYDNRDDLSDEQVEKVRQNTTEERESSRDENETSDKIEEDVKEVTPNNVTACQNNVENISPIKSAKNVDLNPRVVMNTSNNTFDPSSITSLE